jgi:hypothetical protein
MTFGGELGPRSAPDPTAPHLCLWNTERFYGLNPDAAALYQRVDHHDDERLIGSWVGALNDATFTLGFSAPFGGPDLAREYESADNVASLVRAGLEHAAARGARRLEARLKPPHYGEIEAHLLFVLLTIGCRVAEANVNYFIDLERSGGAKAWSEGLRKQARRGIERGAAAGITADVAATDDEPTWADAYRVLEANRTQKGRPMRLPLDYVRSVRDAFPSLVRLVVAHANGSMCAAALLYRILPGRDVVQYWGDAFHELPVSPMGVLIDRVVTHIDDTGGRSIDIGISTDHGWPNLGLMQFKRTFGATAENRLELVGDIDELLGSPAWEHLGG